MKVPEVFSGNMCGGEYNIVCPVCGDDYTHIREVFTRTGCDEHEAVFAYKGTTAKGRTNERRSSLVIVLDGECGHSFEIIIQQHKGNNMVTVEETEPLPESSGGQ